MNKEIVIVTYLSRSGSTKILNDISEQDEVLALNEMYFPPEILGLNGFKELVFQSGIELVSILDELKRHTKNSNFFEEFEFEYSDDIFPLKGTDFFKMLLGQYCDKVKPNSNCILYKGDPFLPWNIEPLVSKFKIINIIRDPRAIYSSQNKSKYSYKGAFNLSPIQTIKEWKASINLKGNDVLNIKYEDYIEDYKNSESEVLKFLGVNNKLTKNKKKLYDFLPKEELHLHSLVTKSPDKLRIDAWRNEININDLAIINSVLKPDLKKLLYSNFGPCAPQYKVKREIIFYECIKFYFKVKGALGMFITEPNKAIRKVKSKLV